MKTTMARTLAALAPLVLLAACAKEEDADPANIDVRVDFPSTAAAVAVDGVKVYVFEAAQTCTDLIRLRQTSQSLPGTVFESGSVSPCQMQSGDAAASFVVRRDTTYTMLAVGTAAGKDLLVGCTAQQGFGETLALPIAMTYIDATQRIPATTCTKLSDKCGGRCQ